MDTRFFRPPSNLEYPPGNRKIFEEFFLENYNPEKIKTERKYIPVLWTNYYIKNNFGSDSGQLQDYLNSLDKNSKYFTIVQYDDNILEDLENLDILIFSQGGFGKNAKKCYPIPLNCEINPDDNLKKNISSKDIFASFIGKIEGRHRIREKMRDTLTGNNYRISEPTSYPDFLDVLSRSKFSLCPRGYGQTSFRIHESLSLGSIPVYIYDKPHIPFPDHFNFSEIGICISEDKISEIDNILTSISDEDIIKKMEAGNVIFKEFFEYSGCFKKIIEILENEKRS